MNKVVEKTNLSSIPLSKRSLKYCCFSLLAAMLMASVPTSMYAQNKANEKEVVGGGNKKSSGKVTYQGTVLDDMGEPLMGVNVKVKGKGTVGMATDMDGKFKFELPEGNYVFEFSYIGMKPLALKAVSGKPMKVRMEPDTQMLKETVVTGIYTRNIESFTGSVSTYSGEELKKISPLNVLRSLSVIDPSFIITENRSQGSNPNALMDVSINGKINVTDLSQEYSTNPNQPLFILDGFETTLQSIQDLNMDRVESISILKDASATAIYGSKAANGVVVVETVKPKQGKLRFSYNANLTYNWPDLSDFNLMNAREKLEYEKLAGVYKTTDGNGYVNLDENGEIISEYQRARYYAKLKLIEEGHDSYWLNEPLRNGLTQGHNIYIDGGDRTFLYGVGLSYNKTTGVMKGSDRDVVNGNIRLTYRLKNLSFTNQTTLSNAVGNNNMVSFSEFSRMNPFYAKRTVDGDIPKYAYKDEVTAGSYDYIWNPLWDFKQKSFNKSDNWTLTNNFQIELRLLRNFRIRGNVQYNMTKGETEVFRSPNETSFVSAEAKRKGSYSKATNSSTSVRGRLNLTYGKSFGDHTINGVGGMQFNDNTRKSDSFAVMGYTTDQFYNPNFSAGFPEGSRPSSRDDKSRSVSYYFNLNYAYMMRYLLDFNYTTNGASQFGIDDPFTTTWSVGAGWNIHEEPFLKDNKYITYFKLRYSLGNPGNENYDAKLSSSIYSYATSGTNPFGLAATVSTWGNNNLKWQRTVTHNFGMDLNICERFNMTANYQIRRTDPLLVRIDMPASTGTTTTPMNVGATDNRSISATFTYYIMKKTDLNWYVSMNMNRYKTKYYNIGNLLEEYNKKGRANKSLMRYYDNASTTGLYVVRSAGIDPATGNEIFIKKDGTYTYEWNVDDEVLYGDTEPKIQGSFNTSFVYKGFTIGAAFSYRYGAMTQLSTLLNKVENISADALNYNQDRRALYDRWQKPGDIARFKRIDDTSRTNMSSRFVAKDNTLQCSSINFGYRTSNAQWLKYIGASSIDFNAYMNDIFRLSSIKEERGTDYPFERSVTFSMGINF